jgi:hypothetical protein
MSQVDGQRPQKGRRQTVAMLLRLLLGCWMLAIGTYFALGLSYPGHSIAGAVVAIYGAAVVIWAIWALRR